MWIEKIVFSWLDWWSTDWIASENYWLKIPALMYYFTKIHSIDEFIWVKTQNCKRWRIAKTLDDSRSLNNGFCEYFTQFLILIHETIVMWIFYSTIESLIQTKSLNNVCKTHNLHKLSCENSHDDPEYLSGKYCWIDMW